MAAQTYDPLARSSNDAQGPIIILIRSVHEGTIETPAAMWAEIDLCVSIRYFTPSSIAPDEDFEQQRRGSPVVSKGAEAEGRNIVPILHAPSAP